MSYQTDKQWSDLYVPEVRRIIGIAIGKRLLENPEMLTVETATHTEDTQHATDFVASIATSMGSVACRLRRPECKARDFTIRSWRASGAKTELEKIRAGEGRWFLYGWTKR
jgi:hypothetical protein